MFVVLHTLKYGLVVTLTLGPLLADCGRLYSFLPWGVPKELEVVLVMNGV